MDGTRKTLHQGLQSSIKAFKVKIATKPKGLVYYITCANYLASSVSSLTKNTRRNVSGVSSGSSLLGIHNADGSINTTGEIKNWKKSIYSLPVQYQNIRDSY